MADDAATPDIDPTPAVSNLSGVCREKHIKYFNRCLTLIPHSHVSLDTSRMTLVFFCLSGLDLMSALDTIKPEKQKGYIDWIYSLQVVRKNSDDDIPHRGGFRGSPFIGNPFNPCCDKIGSVCGTFDGGHLAMTYVALCSLLILGDDLGRVDREYIIESMRHQQLEDGSFRCLPDGSENDMRFLYCAICISYILNDFRGLDREKAIKYIHDSMRYDFGIAQGPGEESHGGSTFCAVAGLSMLGALDTTFTCDEMLRLKQWLLMRQESGFNGRPNKDTDTCYSFWVGSALKILDCAHLSNHQSNREFLRSTEMTVIGGFAKSPDASPDPLHSYFGLCGLSLIGYEDILPIHPALNLSLRAAKQLEHLGL